MDHLHGGCRFHRINGPRGMGIGLDTPLQVDGSGKVSAVRVRNAEGLQSTSR